jgi:hypothetical protein
MNIPALLVSAAFVLPNLDVEGRRGGLLWEIRVTCKQVSSCEQAVEIWCNGYSRADGDSDGIPCENVCHSVEQVEAIRSQQGC